MVNLLSSIWSAYIQWFRSTTVLSLNMANDGSSPFDTILFQTLSSPLRFFLISSYNVFFQVLDVLLPWFYSYFPFPAELRIQSIVIC
jgi:hypothetical protein